MKNAIKKLSARGDNIDHRNTTDVVLWRTATIDVCTEPVQLLYRRHIIRIGGNGRLVSSQGCNYDVLGEHSELYYFTENRGWDVNGTV